KQQTSLILHRNDFTIKKFKKGLKRIWICYKLIYYFTIKKFKKGLKPMFCQVSSEGDFTIKKFKKGLKL
ncbi:hypothetical protein GYL81_001743, partial [Campylobacter coli]|nr:hypothetical protein [Campylobacter coli]